MSLRCRLFYLIGSLLAIQNLSAQIVLTQSDFGSIGDVVIYRVDTGYRGNVTTGTTGVNQTWNFNNLIPTGLNDTSKFISPSLVNGTASFPACNLVIDENGVQNFNRKDSTGVFLLALKLDIDTSLINLGPIPINPQLKVIGFPTTYNTITTSNATANTVLPVKDTIQFDSTTSIYVDSASINLTINVRDTVNGWGTLQIQNLTLQALRQKTYLKITPSIQIKIRNPFWSPNFPANLLPQFIWVPLPATITIPNLDNLSVRYYASGKKYPILEFGLDTAGNVTSTRFQTSNSLIQNLNEEETLKDVSVYPNPVQNILYLSTNFPSLQFFSVNIYDINGKLTMQSILDRGNARVEVSGLAKGLYILIVKDQSSGYEKVLRFNKE